MKRTSLSILFLIFQPLASFSQNQPGCLLWEVSMPGSVHRSYLLGTFHEVNSTFFRSIPHAAEKLKQCKVLFVEQTAPDAHGGSQRKAVENLSMKKTWDVRLWNTLLNADQKTIFGNFIEKSQDSSWYRSSPLLLLLTLNRIYSQNFCDTTARSSNQTMDGYIENFAVENHLQTRSLDTDQMAIIENASNDNGSGRDLMYAEACSDLMDKMLRDDASQCSFMEDYRNFKLDYQFDTELKNINISSSFLLDRNKKWIQTLDQAFKDTSCFVAVGIRHLFYQEGLVRQLRQRGYSVEPVVPDRP
ncbi:TraB/GumN family protein [Dyadobacter psychrotolerans]|uniref:TraB/GumN family protein n=1 Tax=Dyadobacter psychrotolerans TaxID=2541721 RepID=A0A4R5DAX4_9BACT|nr:TraB/GumN family protein [Dyadobacter psychrotolerans]TDE10826.1 TraB/GumN family protein [Dyadobacter psychrotolerans]